MLSVPITLAGYSPEIFTTFLRQLKCISSRTGSRDLFEWKRERIPWFGVMEYYARVCDHVCVRFCPRRTWTSEAAAVTMAAKSRRGRRPNRTKSQTIEKKIHQQKKTDYAFKIDYFVGRLSINRSIDSFVETVKSFSMGMNMRKYTTPTGWRKIDHTSKLFFWHQVTCTWVLSRGDTLYVPL